MASSKLNAEQAAKQKVALKEFHEKVKSGEAPTSAKASLRPRKNKSLKTLSERMSDMLPKALDLIEDVLDGKEVDKQKADMAKYVANNAVTLTKAQIEYESSILKFKVDMAKAQEANIVPKEDPQAVAKDLASRGAHIRLEVPEEYEEDDEYD